jgi:copper chaperone CopZ
MVLLKRLKNKKEVPFIIAVMKNRAKNNLFIYNIFKKKNMKNILLLLAISISIVTKAQVTKVSLQASGLTCSMCSNAINKALKSLEFVDKVDADIKNYTFEISFKEASHVDFDKMRRKVEDAGFSVSGFVATIYFDNVRIKADQPVTIGNNALLFAELKDLSLNGVKQVRLLDKGFVSSKEYKRNKVGAESNNPGLYHVSL